MTYFLAGAALGLAGSVHCAGMCGPLLLAVHHGVPRAPMMRRMALYHGARVLMYALLGIPAGYAAHALSFGVFGRTVAVIAGVLLVAAAAGSLVSRYANPLSQAWSTAVVRIGAQAARLTRGHPHYGYLVLGAINGFLPCGLVYAAVAAAAASGSVAAAVTFMIGFGAGTVPLLFMVTVSATSLPAHVRHRFRFVAPVLMVVAGVLLIVRAFMPLTGGAHKHDMSAVGRERRGAEITGKITHGGTELTENRTQEILG